MRRTATGPDRLARHNRVKKPEAEGMVNMGKVVDAIHLKHHSIRTEQSYMNSNIAQYIAACAQ
jgi:hypothetical protein